MKILALEPYYGGSHKAFLDDWSAKGGHEFTIMALSAYKWKWRMRHSAITFAANVEQSLSEGQSWDLIFCSDMLNLAEFMGLAPAEIQKLPVIAYFHENQLTYPVRFESERDYQFAMTNMTTALAADSVWFNTAYHRDSFLEALAAFLRKMPDYQPTDAPEKIRAKTQIHPPGINEIHQQRQPRKPGPVRILWAARWEHDKMPEVFFQALQILKTRGIDFRINVVGEQFREVPEVFEWAKDFFADHIDRWGYQKTRGQYEQALTEADLIVSTAEHEFFGISVVEAVSAGAWPVLPKRLAYPEILRLNDNKTAEEFFYDGTVEALAERLTELADLVRKDCLWGRQPDRAADLVERFKWQNLAPILDEAAKQVARQK